MTDYKNYSLENLDNWLHDAFNCDDLTSQEIYDTIVNSVQENLDYHKKYFDKSNELLSLLKGYRTVNFDDWEINAGISSLTGPDSDQPIVLGNWDYDAAGAKFPREETKPKSRTWTIPVEQVHDDYFISFPDDLLEAANLKEGDTVEWIDRKDGSYEMRKITRPLKMDEC